MSASEKAQNDVKGKDTFMEVTPFRRALPQVLATSAKNLILLDLGMTLAFPTLVIPALLNSKDTLNFTATQASWFGSIAFICQPIGSILSGTLLEPLGRKNAMLLVNIPHLLGWYLFWYSQSLTLLYLAAIVMGLGVGFMEAPVITYVGEISEPHLRGILTSYSGIFVTVGLVVEFTLGAIYPWRTTAFVSSFIPIVTIIAISQVPETPMWLLSKGKLEEAEKSLCWLRGWVTPATVKKELNELTNYSDSSKLVLKEKTKKLSSIVDENKNKSFVQGYCNEINLNDEMTTTSSAENSNGTGEDFTKSKDVATVNFEEIPLPNQIPNHKERKASLKELIMDMVRPEMLKPLSLIIFFFCFHHGSGMSAFRPYMVNMFDELKFPVDAHVCTVIVSVMGFVGVVVCMVFVRLVGKRCLTLASLAGSAFGMIALSVWCYLHNDNQDNSTYWFPFITFCFYSFCFSFGIAPIPWMLLSEVFPFRGRGLASGIAAAISYVMGFIASKTFLDLKSWLSLSGVFLLYGSITTAGIAYIYTNLPETEGRSLQDIENNYKEKIQKKLNKSTP